MQLDTFREKGRLDIIVNIPERKRKTLTEWFVYNNKNTDGRNLTYLNFPFRVCVVSRLQKMAAKIDCNKEVAWKANLCSSKLRAAYEALGLLGNDKEWDIALEESDFSATSAEIKTLFAQILIYCDVSNPSKLWDKHCEAMRDDIPMNISKSTGIPNYHVNTTELPGYILYELKAILNGFGKCVKDFGLQPPPEHLLKNLENKLLIEEKNYNRELLMQDVVQTLRDLMNAPDLIFGGKTVVLGGDFRQTLPVKKGVGKQELITASIAESHLWWHFKIFLLTINMRLLRSDLNDQEQRRSEFFAKWLLDVGNGEIGEPGH
uniref:ATP-dependent DNA helicase n=1 Tax=Tanacetum cinerariifolium TaxID=118510 RepID=A0A699JJN9_TANCI|nr:DNA helicase [Tanacetum cinerariifolium]